VNPAACPECQVGLGKATAQGCSPWRSGPFLVHPSLDPSPVAGWLVIAPARHVEGWDALDAAEQRELGPLVARVSGALRAETKAAKVYVSLFAEVLPHFHLHVVARPADLPVEERGARIFLAERGVPEAEAQAVWRGVLSRLVSARPVAQGGPSPWMAALLSGLVFPGAGQAKNRRFAKALAFLLPTAALLARLAWQVSSEAVDALLDPKTPLGVWELAEEIQRRHAAEFSWTTVILLALWAGSVYDAWRDATLSAGGSAPTR